ncbi:hypothetical protein DFH09DRAFT_1467053 [Mycena vulgaris]|nr:hypothetical protein DFH09DRAFT_1467053 [Mycena vulgaris]
MASTLQTINGKVVKVELISDIPLEVFSGKVGFYWDETAGSSSIPAVAASLLMGPMVDFWRLTMHHDWYLLHALFTSRLLHVMDPIVIISQSNPIAAILRSFDLVNVWSDLPTDITTDILNGSTPLSITSILPNNFSTRSYDSSDFKKLIGTIQIIRTSIDASKLALNHRGYTPRLTRFWRPVSHTNYNSILARLKWALFYLIHLISDTLVQAAAHKLKHDDVINWSEAEAVRRWLEEVKGAAELRLDETELAVTFLRTLVRAPPKSYTYTVRKERLKAAPSGDARNTQLAEILDRARQLDSFDLPPDPDHLALFCHPILSDTFPSWFLSLKDGVEIVASVNSHGRSDKGCAAADATHAAIAQWNKDNVDVVAIAQKNMRVAIRHGESLGMTEVIIKELQWSWRAAICDRCDSFCIANHNAAYHRCPDTVDDSEDRTLLERNFPIIDRILYAHNILHEPRGHKQLGNMSDLLSELHLFAIPVRRILQSREGNATLVKALRPLDVTAEVFVSEVRINDLEFLVTLAFDVVLAQHSTCSQVLQPVSPNHRRAWKVEVSDMLADWYNGKAEDLHIVRCTGNPNEPPTGPPEGSWFITTKVKTKIARNGGGQTVDQTCCMCSDSKACRFRKFDRVSTLFDLPPHYARRLWFALRFTTSQPDTRLSKVKKAEQKPGKSQATVNTKAGSSKSTAVAGMSECVTVVWMYRCNNGNIITLRGLLTAHLAICSPAPPYMLKFNGFEFNAHPVGAGQYPVLERPTLCDKPRLRITVVLHRTSPAAHLPLAAACATPNRCPPSALCSLLFSVSSPPRSVSMSVSSPIDRGIKDLTQEAGPHTHYISICIDLIEESDACRFLRDGLSSLGCIFESLVASRAKLGILDMTPKPDHQYYICDACERPITTVPISFSRVRLLPPRQRSPLARVPRLLPVLHPQSCALTASAATPPQLSCPIQLCFPWCIRTQNATAQYYATFDPNPSAPEPLSMTPCFKASTKSTPHMNQTVLYDPKTSVVQPMWYHSENDGTVDDTSASTVNDEEVNNSDADHTDNTDPGTSVILNSRDGPQNVRPKTKPTKKEAKTLRCRKYVREILTASLQDDLLTADDFFSNLMKPFRGDSVEQETFAMSKLARGYMMGTPDSWRAARGAVDFASLLLQVYLKQELEYAKIDDLTQRLLLRHHNLGRQETTSDISNFLRVLFQTVNSIEFSVEVKKLGAGSRGTKHKTALYQSMYDAEGVSDSYATAISL